MKGRGKGEREAAESMAIQALSYIASDGERLSRFLALTGIGPGEIRAAAVEPGFLVGVLEYLASDEALLNGFAAENEMKPEVVDAARQALGGWWERETP